MRIEELPNVVRFYYAKVEKAGHCGSLPSMRVVTEQNPHSPKRYRRTVQNRDIQNHVGLSTRIRGDTQKVLQKLYCHSCHDWVQQRPGSACLAQPRLRQ